MDFRERLKIETSPEHQNLESLSRIMQPDFSLRDYAQILSRWAIFYRAFEAELDQNRNVAPDAYALMENRRKKDLLERDVRVFDLYRPAAFPPHLESELQRFLKIAFASYSTIWAVLYVLEGSSLGAQVITRHLKTRFELQGDEGVLFYKGYGENTGPMWREFVGALSKLELTKEMADEGVEAAKETFRFFGRFLESSSALGSALQP